MKSLKGLSDKKINAEVTKWNKKVTDDAKRITNAKNAIKKAKSQIDDVDDFLNKNNGYKSQKDAYKDLTKQINEVDKKLSSEKRKSKQSSLKKEKESLVKKQKDVNASMRKIAGSSGYANMIAKRGKAQTVVKTQTEVVKNITKRKTANKKTATSYSNEKKKRTAAKNKKIQQKNSQKISQKISSNRKKYPHLGTTAVYRADLKSSTVIMLVESSPNESTSNSNATHPTPKSNPRNNYSVRSDKNLSGTYQIIGDSFDDADKKYVALETWAKDGREIAISGFSKWSHAFFTSVGKSMDTPSKYSLNIDLGLTYARKTKEKVTKKSKKKGKAKANKKSGKKKTTAKSSYKYIKVKPGMTYWQISNKYGVSISWLEKNNKYKSTSLPVGGKVRIS